MSVEGINATGLPPTAEAECKDVLFVIYVIIFGSMCVFGLVGNTLSILVLQWEKQNSVATFMLQSLAMADNFFLLATGFSQIYAAMTLFLDEQDHVARPFIQVFIWPLVHITQLGTIWMTVMVAANRYIVICKPFQAHKLCTMAKVRLQVLVIAIFSVLYCLPRFFELKLEYNNDMTEAVQTNLVKDHLYAVIYESTLYCLFVFLGPLVILTVLNVCLIRELMAARKRLIQRQLPIPGEEEEQNLTLVMIVIVLIFVICQTPAFINQLLGILLPQSEYACGYAYFYYYHVSNLLVSANSSVNFFVYCAFRAQFRHRLRAFCQRDRTALKYANASYSDDGRTTSVYSRNGRCDNL